MRERIKVYWEFGSIKLTLLQPDDLPPLLVSRENASIKTLPLHSAELSLPPGCMQNLIAQKRKHKADKRVFNVVLYYNFNSRKTDPAKPFQTSMRKDGGHKRFFSHSPWRRRLQTGVSLWVSLCCRWCSDRQAAWSTACSPQTSSGSCTSGTPAASKYTRMHKHHEQGGARRGN